MRRLKGPRSEADWTIALSKELTAENAAYLSRGKMKRGVSYAAVFNRLSDYAVNHLNAALAALKSEDDSATETVFLLKRFGGVLGRVYFFRSLGFLHEIDEKRLEHSIAAAVKKLTAQIKQGLGTDDADILYELFALNRMAGNGNYE